MLSRAVDDDITRGFAEIQKRVDAEHARSQALSAERDSLAEKVKALEARVVGLEAERTALHGDVQTLRGARVVLEEEVQMKRELSNSIRLAACRARNELGRARLGSTRLGSFTQ